MVPSTLDKAKELQSRTKQFALRVIRLSRELPRTDEGRVIGRQLLQSGTSVGGNYRAACWSRSTAEFASKINVVAEEADESLFWLELLVESETMPIHKMKGIIQEASELIAIFTASKNTARKNRQSPTH